MRSRTQADLVNVTASPTVAVLANNIAVGDEADISLLFKARALDQRTWQLLDAILAESRGAAASAAGVLELVGRRWNELDESDVRTGPTYDEISRYLSQGTVRKRAASKEGFLRQLGEETKGRRSLAEAHASRR
jgi:hypothetical protein